MDPQVQEVFAKVVAALGTLSVAATAIVGFFNGPRASKARKGLDIILGFLRMVGFGTYKDEPGTYSMPLKRDTGERVATTEPA
jgi:hypothetical protein